MTAVVQALERELYSAPEAARLLRMRVQTLRYWLEGQARGNTNYPPVVRPVATGSDIVTWGEFVECGFLREYRRAGVSLQRLRPAISRMRERFEVPYPLAHKQPYVAEGSHLVWEVQQEAEVPTSLRIWERADDGQLSLNLYADSFFQKVDFADTAAFEAVRIWPDGRDSGVVIDPDRSFGSATVKGIRTDNLADLVRAGEPVEHVREWFELEATDLADALRFEDVPVEVTAA